MDVPAYVDCCVKEIESYGASFKKQKLISIYFGGGTPSALEYSHIRKLLNALRRVFLVPARCEITLEANPSSITKEKAGAWKEYGINRVSVGVQSFIDKELATLNRLHTARQAHTALALLREKGFANLGIDLMFGVPRQTGSTFAQSLERAVSYAPKHISVYGLTVEPGTPLALCVQGGTCSLPSPKTYNRMFLFAHTFLQQSGYAHYEVSNYSLPGFHSRHNSHYWEQKQYLGIGAAAHSFISGKRIANLKDVAGYCNAIGRNAHAHEFEEVITPRQFIHETVMLGLRTAAGVHLPKLRAAGYDILHEKRKLIARLKKENLIAYDSRRLRLTPAGWLVLDEITLNLLE